MTQVIDREQAIALLERVVAERGEKYTYTYRESDPVNEKYGSCLYEYEGAPDCGIGLALSYLGVEPEDLAELDRQGVDGDETGITNLPVVKYLEHKCGITFEDDGLPVFAEFQAFQDLGRPYSEALRLARVVE